MLTLTDLNNFKFDAGSAMFLLTSWSTPEIVVSPSVERYLSSKYISQALLCQASELKAFTLIDLDSQVPPCLC